jgi:hypothetical protein
MDADKVGVARPPANVVGGGCRMQFQETLQKAGYYGGNSRFGSDASAFIRVHPRQKFLASLLA